MTMEQEIIKDKLGLLKLAQTLRNVSEASKVMRDICNGGYRSKELLKTGGEIALQKIFRRKPNLKNGADEDIQKVVLALALEKPSQVQLNGTISCA